MELALCTCSNLGSTLTEYHGGLHGLVVLGLVLVGVRHLDWPGWAVVMNRI